MLTTRLALPALALVLAAVPSAARPAPPPHVAGEVLVRFRDGAAAERRARAVDARAHVAIAALDGGFTRVRVRTDESVEEAVAAYVGDPAVEWAQPNYVYRLFAAPTDPLYGQQWALRNTGQTVAATYLQPGRSLYTGTSSNPGTSGRDIGAEAAWDLVSDCSSVVVAVVDSGVNHLHEDLSANIWRDPVTSATGADFVDMDADPMDANGHGTHVAGIIAARANNGAGTAGVCWSARIMAIRAMDAAGTGTSATIARGIDWAVAHGAGVLNLSLGAYAADAILSGAVSDAVNAGAVVVVAAGNEQNDNDATPVYPCNAPSLEVLCVAALDQNLGLATFSNYGARTVDVGAPGANIVAPYAGTGTAVDEPLTAGSGWAFSSTSGTGFGYAIASDGQGDAVPVLADPTGDGLYPASTDDRAWKTFDTSGADAVTVDFYAVVSVSRYDYFRAACRAAPGDPFGAGAVLLEQVTAVRGESDDALDLSPCRGPATTLGFQLQASPPSTSTDTGVMIGFMTRRTLTRNATSYDTLKGTSMAAPVVAGVAALVRAYQPAFTPADVHGAITGGGRAVPSLAGKVSSGKAVNAHGALRYVNPPRGLRAVVVD